MKNKRLERALKLRKAREAANKTSVRLNSFAALSIKLMQKKY